VLPSEILTYVWSSDTVYFAINFKLSGLPIVVLGRGKVLYAFANNPATDNTCTFTTNSLAWQIRKSCACDAQIKQLKGDS